jgi:uncharacterized membrane protein YobD (UPF0266 family)
VQAPDSSGQGHSPGVFFAMWVILNTIKIVAACACCMRLLAIIFSKKGLFYGKKITFLQ